MRLRLLSARRWPPPLPPPWPPNPLRPVPHLAVSSLLAISDTKLLLTEARRAIGCRDRTAPEARCSQYHSKQASPPISEPTAPGHAAGRSNPHRCAQQKLARVPSRPVSRATCPQLPGSTSSGRRRRARNSIPRAADCFPALAKLRAIHDRRRPRVTTL